MPTDLNILVFRERGEKFVFCWRDDNLVDAMRNLARWAANPELSLSWMDAAEISQRMRDMAEEKEVVR